MIFIIGAILFLAGVWMLLRFLKLAKRPKVDDAYILDVTHEHFIHKKYPDHPSPRKLPHAKVEYYFQSVKYVAKILLKTKKCVSGDKIRLTVNSESPNDVEQYEPNREVLVILLVLSLGTGIMICSVLILNYLDA